MIESNGEAMSGKPSRVKQREIQQVVKGGFRAGATKIVVQLGDASIIIHARGEEPKVIEPDEPITL
jgi:hypothetical protein